MPASPKLPPTLQRVEEAQRRLDKASNVYRQAQDERRAAVKSAWLAGATTRELSDVLSVSRQKVYGLIGGVRRSKPANAS